MDDQLRVYNVCNAPENYNDNIFRLSDYNGDLNGGNYRIILISMNASWWPACYGYISMMDQILEFTNANIDLEFLVSWKVKFIIFFYNFINMFNSFTYWNFYS